jgi:hypothetical protein
MSTAKIRADGDRSRFYGDLETFSSVTRGLKKAGYTLFICNDEDADLMRPLCKDTDCSHMRGIVRCRSYQFVRK